MAQMIKDPSLSLLWCGLIPGLGTSTCCKHGQKKKKKNVYLETCIHLFHAKILENFSGIYITKMDIRVYVKNYYLEIRKENLVGFK